jgi:hypothetical protein
MIQKVSPAAAAEETPSFSERLAGRTGFEVLSQLVTSNDRFRTQPVEGFVTGFRRRGIPHCFVSGPHIYFVVQEPLMFRAGHVREGRFPSMIE